MYDIFIATTGILTTFFMQVYIYDIFINLYSLILNIWKEAAIIIYESGWRFVAFRSSAPVTFAMKNLSRS